MKRSLLLLSFVEGGAVMCSELCGARLLAPLFGTSLYVWAAVMGVTLGALAMGYFFGGQYVYRARQRSALRNILVAASVYLLLMPLIARFLLPFFSSFPFTAGVIAGTMVLLLPPVFLLGAASPLFIGIQAAVDDAGRVSGTVYAVSTAGGILSTFLCGFLLIPDLGLTVSLLIHGGILLLCTLFILRGNLAAPVFFCAFAFTLFWRTQNTGDVVYAEDGVHGRVEVRDLDESGVPLRRLLLNGIIQTEINRGNGKSTMKYLVLVDSVLFSRKGHAALVLGAGGGSLPNLLVKRGYDVTAVEFDRRIIGAAQRHFSVHPSVELVHDDARRYINSAHAHFDVVVVDVFKAEEQPAHVLTVESLGKIKQLLDPDGILLVNWHGYSEGILAEGTNVLLNTFTAAGFLTSLVFTGTDPHYRNTLICAAPGIAPYQYAGPVNSDDRPALEKYNAGANAAWRRNYLKYYLSNR